MRKNNVIGMSKTPKKSPPKKKVAPKKKTPKKKIKFNGRTKNA